MKNSKRRIIRRRPWFHRAVAVAVSILILAQVLSEKLSVFAEIGDRVSMNVSEGNSDMPEDSSDISGAGPEMPGGDSGVSGGGASEGDSDVPEDGTSGEDASVSGGGASFGDAGVPGSGASGGDTGVPEGGASEGDSDVPGGGMSGGDTGVPGGGTSGEDAGESGSSASGGDADGSGDGASGGDSDASGGGTSGGDAGVSGGGTSGGDPSTPVCSIVPNDPKAAFGDTLTLRVEIEGIGETYDADSFSYSWYKDSTLLDGAESEALEIAPVLRSDAGAYSCTISWEDNDGSTKSQTLTTTLTVSEATPTVSLAASPESGTPYGSEGITLTATVAHPNNNAVDQPTGTVEFFSDGESIGSAVLSDGTASIKVTLTSSKEHQIYAKYSGESSGNYGEGCSEEIAYQVGKVTPAEGIDYERNAPDGSNGWYKAGNGLVISPLGLFDQIRMGEAEGAPEADKDQEWKDSLVISEDTPVEGTEIVFYLRNASSGEISNPQRVSYKMDQGQPRNGAAVPKIVAVTQGEDIPEEPEEWEREYLGDVNGGGENNRDNFLYHVILSAEDQLSGVAFFQWKYVGDEEWSQEVEAAEGKAQIGVAYEKWHAGHGIELRVCDRAGNFSEYTIPAQNALSVEYDRANLKRYVDESGRDVSEADIDESTHLIYDQTVRVTFTANALKFAQDEIDIRVNDAPAPVRWEEKDGLYVGTLELSEGNSVVKISADGYDIVSNEIGSRTLWEEYCSNTHVVDMTPPAIELAFDMEGAQAGEDMNIFVSDCWVTVSVIEDNFRPDELFFSCLEAKDIEGNPVSGFEAAGCLEALKTAEWRTEGNRHSAQILFSWEARYNFALEYSDLAGNQASSCSPKPFEVDKSIPGNLRISYDSDPIGTFLQAVTFGYYKPSLTVRIFAEDAVSGISRFNWTYTREESASTDKNIAIVSAQIDAEDTEHFHYEDNGRTAVATFTLSADEAAQYRGIISFTATDKAGHTSYVNYGEGSAKNEEGELYNTSKNHVVVLDTISPIRKVTYPVPQQIREADTLDIFEGDLAERANQENSNSILYYDDTYGDVIPVTLKITEANFYAEDVKVKINNEDYTVEDWTQEGDAWSGTIGLTEDGSYIITADYTDRSGNSMLFYQSEQIVIDRARPAVVRYEFEPAAADGSADTSAFVEALEYGYYFKTDFSLKIHVADNAPSSGLDTVAYRLISYENGAYQKEIEGIVPVADGVARVPVPAGFKGQIFAQCYDNAGNKSPEVVPRAFVVDRGAPEIAVNINNQTEYADAAGNLLFVADMSVTVTITDSVSGISRIGYAQKSEIDAFDRREITLGNTGYRVGDDLGDGWTVASTDANLVTGVTKVFSYNKDNNDVMLSFDAADRAGNWRTGVSSKAFSLDKTEPVIHVVFREDVDTDEYYETNRIADVTVIERNFDPSLILTSIENRFGSIPGVAFTQVSNMEYRAVIDFDEGDYTFEISGKDLGGHEAAVDYSGGNERMFYVDKTKPLVTENFAEFTNSATESTFNQDKTVSISITEHNFDPELVKLRIFRKPAGSEHNGAALEDVTEQMIRSGVWSAEGDVHSISFEISEDAVYRVEMSPADLAGNEADYATTTIFEIDKTLPVVSARNGRAVNAGDTAFVDIYTSERSNEPVPTVEFSDLNMDHIRYELTGWIPDYSDPEALPMIKPVRMYLSEDEAKTGITYGSMFELPSFSEDGMYALELTAVDIAGNESALNINTYARMTEKDVLAYIMHSNVEERTGLYSFQYEDGTPISMRPGSFKDMEIMVMAKEGTDVRIVLRDTEGGDKEVNAQVSLDDSVYGFTIYDFLVKADFFRENYFEDTDTDLYLTVENGSERTDLGKIHIDNMEPTCDIPEDFSSWHWYRGEETRTIILSNINEQLDEEHTRVLDNGEEIAFTYSAEERTLSFQLGVGWHNVGIVLSDIAGNENIIQERVNIYVGYFWAWFMLFGAVAVPGAVALTVVLRRRRLKRKGSAERAD